MYGRARTAVALATAGVCLAGLTTARAAQPAALSGSEDAAATSPAVTVPAVPAGLHALAAGHNNIHAKRINLVVAAYKAPKGVNWVAAARRMLSMTGPQVLTSQVPGFPAQPYGLSWGAFSIEPLRSHAKLFNVWYIDKPAPHVWGWDKPGDRTGGRFPVPLADRLEIILVFGPAARKDSSGAVAVGLLPRFAPPAVPRRGADVFMRIHLLVADPAALGRADSGYDEILSHELGHALFGLRDKYLFDRGTVTDGGTAYPSCAASKAQAKAFYGPLVGTVDPFVKQYLAAYTKAGLARTADEIADIRRELVVAYVAGGCFGPRGTAMRSSRGGLMYGAGAGTPLYDAVERRWAERVLDAWAGTRA